MKLRIVRNPDFGSFVGDVFHVIRDLDSASVIDHIVDVKPESSLEEPFAKVAIEDIGNERFECVPSDSLLKLDILWPVAPVERLEIKFLGLCPP